MSNHMALYVCVIEGIGHENLVRVSGKGEQKSFSCVLVALFSTLTLQERIDQNVHKAKQERAKADVEWMKKVCFFLCSWVGMREGFTFKLYGSL